jgi:ABC-type methionine transport system permease subunit
VAAVLDYFRSIKLRDVWNGVCEVANAVFRGVPYVIWKIIESAGILVAGIIILIFGGAGKLMLLLIKALWYVAKYVPEQLAEIIAGIWSSIAKGYHEVMVWINPKH